MYGIDQIYALRGKSWEIPYFLVKSRDIISGKSRPKKSRDPGIWQNPVQKNPGIEILDPARAWLLHAQSFIFQLAIDIFKETCSIIFEHKL